MSPEGRVDFVRVWEAGGGMGGVFAGEMASEVSQVVVVVGAASM